MPVTYSDQEVERLLLERKPMPSDWSSRVRLRPKRGHQERDLTLSGDVGSEFRLILKREDSLRRTDRPLRQLPRRTAWSDW